MTLTRRIGLTVLATAMAAILAVLHHHFRPEAAERIDLHGTWRIMSRVSKGQLVPAAPDETVVIDGVAMTFMFKKADEPGEEGRFRLSTRAVPKKMDIRFRLKEGSVPANGWDGLTRAVFERDGPTLRLAWYSNDLANPDPNQRPVQFPAVLKPYSVGLELAR
jgi:uncharacterized protein (TIGR03067 family)